MRNKNDAPRATLPGQRVLSVTEDAYLSKVFFIRGSSNFLFGVVPLALLLFACELPVEKNLKKGELSALVSEPYAVLLQQQAEEFHRLYRETKVVIAATTTREAIVRMLNDTVRVICIERQFNEEERAAFQAAEVGTVETKIAEDALAVLVSQQNPMRNASLATLKDIVSGAKTSWSEVPESKWSGPIELVLTGRNSGTYELLTRHFLKLANEPTPAHVAETSRGVLEYVDSHPQALGIVSSAALQDSLPNIRVLSLEAADSIAAGRPFVMLHQANIHRGFYPWHFPVYMYRLQEFTGIALGFTAFVASAPGQKMLLEAKLVPATMPVRIVQLKEN